MGKLIEWPLGFRPMETAGSVWDKVSQGPSKQWTHWPNPFPFLRDFKVLACEQEFIFQATFWGLVALRWFWSNFIPSPVELTRKTVSGGYKCGFYMTDGFGSPLDLIWEDKSVSKAVLQISGPFTETLFYLWAAQTSFSGLQSAQHAILAAERCNADKNEVILFAGGGDFNFSPESGAPVGFSVAYDPLNRYDGIASIQFFAGDITGYAVGWLTTNGKTVSHAEIYIRSAVYEGPHTILSGLAPGTITPWRVTFSMPTFLTQDFEIRMDIIQSGGGSSNLGVARFIMSYNRLANFDDPTHLTVPDPCKSKFLSPMNYNPVHPSAV